MTPRRKYLRDNFLGGKFFNILATVPEKYFAEIISGDPRLFRPGAPRISGKFGVPGVRARIPASPPRGEFRVPLPYQSLIKTPPPPPHRAEAGLQGGVWAVSGPGGPNWALGPEIAQIPPWGGLARIPGSGGSRTPWNGGPGGGWLLNSTSRARRTTG